MFIGLLVSLTLVISACNFSGSEAPELNDSQEVINTDTEVEESRSPSSDATDNPVLTPVEEEDDLRADETTEEVMTMYVTVQVSPEVARVLNEQAPATTESQELLKITEELGVVLEPVHPDIDDPLLATFFRAEVPDSATAEQVIARLRQSNSVEAAYLKPPDELP